MHARIIICRHKYVPNNIIYNAHINYLYRKTSSQRWSKVYIDIIGSYRGGKLYYVRLRFSSKLLQINSFLFTGDVVDCSAYIIRKKS